jgi:hypothetical protein
MEKGWKEVFLTTLEYQAEMAKSILEKNGINVVVINQNDTISHAFGEFIVYVEEHLESQAIELLKDLKN